MEKICLVVPCSHNHAASDRSHVVRKRVQGCHGESVSEAPPKCESPLRVDRYVRSVRVSKYSQIPQYHPLSAIISVAEAEKQGFAVGRAALKYPSSLLMSCGNL